MKIDINKQYRTRAGQRVRILCTDRGNKTTPVVALVYSDGNEQVITYSIEGRVTSSGYDSPFDLIEVLEWENLAIDDPVLVKDEEHHPWLKRHFAGLTHDGKPSTWPHGFTSWSTDPGNHRTTWVYFKKPEV